MKSTNEFADCEVDVFEEVSGDQRAARDGRKPPERGLVDGGEANPMIVLAAWRPSSVAVPQAIAHIRRRASGVDFLGQQVRRR